jgi:hypothetical protein
MVKLSLEWVDLLRTDFGMITKKLMGKGGVTEDQIRATINKDTGKNMLAGKEMNMFPPMKELPKFPIKKIKVDAFMLIPVVH